MFDHSSADPLDLIDPPRRAAVDHSGPANARTCKKAIQKALKPKPSASGAKEQERQESSPALLDAKLQLCCAFIPGILADSHVSLVAKKLISAVSDIALTSGMVTKPVAFLTQKLGDTFDRKFLLRAKMNVASVLLDHEKKFLADLVAREHQPKDSNCKGYITALTWMWDETEQTASNVLSQLQTSLDPFLYSMLERLPLTKTYLEAKRRGASTSNVVMSTIVQQGELQVVDLMDSTWGQPLAKKVPILVPPCRLLRMTASTIKGVLDYWMPLTATKRTKLADSALYNLIIYVADGATANSLFKKHEVMESQPNTLAPSWLSTPAARSESDSDSDHEDDSHPSDDGAPHTLSRGLHVQRLVQA